jgi:transposase-like protein
VRCPSCDSPQVVRNGWDDARHARQRWLRKDCKARVDDLTGTVLAGHHQPLRVWVLCLYFMGLNLSNRQIAQELDLNESDVQAMTSRLGAGWAGSRPSGSRRYPGTPPTCRAPSGACG